MAWLLSYCSVQELACRLPANRLQPGAQPLNVASQAGPAVGREPIGHRVNVSNESFVDTSRIRALRRLDELTRPAATSHAGMTLEDRERLGITADLIRVSCGIEGTQDLIADFDQALARA